MGRRFPLSLNQLVHLFLRKWADRISTGRSSIPLACQCHTKISPRNRLRITN